MILIYSSQTVSEVIENIFSTNITKKFVSNFCFRDLAQFLQLFSSDEMCTFFFKLHISYLLNSLTSVGPHAILDQVWRVER